MGLNRFFGMGGDEHGPIRQLFDQWRQAMVDGDEELAGDLFMSVMGVIGQQMYSLTRECASEVKAALLALGHVSYANLVCQVYLTWMPDAEVDEHGQVHPKKITNADGEVGDSSSLLVGARLHGEPEDPEGFEAAFNQAIIAALRAHGMAASWGADGKIEVRGQMSHLDAHIEEQATKFADDIEKELGESAPNPETGERKWW